ncbi:MAG: hypothetical protein JOZ60_10495 [Verrucomicrobia bacterium]|nr:hypothetical protein [Verrucomicrobiota bacterium]
MGRTNRRLVPHSSHWRAARTLAGAGVLIGTAGAAAAQSLPVDWSREGEIVARTSIAISAALLIFLFQWESFLWPLIATPSENLKVIQVALAGFQERYVTLWNELLPRLLSPP